MRVSITCKNVMLIQVITFVYAFAVLNNKVTSGFTTPPLQTEALADKRRAVTVKLE